MTWFEDLTGVEEKSHAFVQQQLFVEGSQLRSRVNGKSWQFGTLETPTLEELRQRRNEGETASTPTVIREQVADVQSLHRDSANANALFQVASQFNLLEMVSPDVGPEEGVGIYQYDRTQGPACAIAAGAGTIFRNYFAPVNGRVGQTDDDQIDCLHELGKALGNSEERLWRMVNGYALPSLAGLQELHDALEAMDEFQLDDLKQRLRVGLQWNTEVTLQGASHTVSQVYCSAVPVAYTPHSATLWQPFARLVLEATYEAAFSAAVLNLQSTGVNTLYLTLVGGGAFGNKLSWITESISRALEHFQDAGLDIAIVSYGSSKSCVQELVQRMVRPVEFAKDLHS